MALRETLTQLVKRAIDTVVFEKGVDLEVPLPLIEMTRDRKFGDYATNVAMVLAPRLGVNPRDLAIEISEVIRKTDGNSNLHGVSVAGPGFINMTMTHGFWSRILGAVLEEGEDFARTDAGGGRKVQVEFVSANPTGPLHVGHGRGAALGDALANILACSGFDVEREYYINDAGNQILTLGRSVYARYLQLFERKGVFPEEGYRGEYVSGIAAFLKEDEGDRFLTVPEDDAVGIFAARAAELILEDIRRDLEEFGVRFDVWYSEKRLLDEGKVKGTLRDLESRGSLYRHEGALWFHSKERGDDKDRVLVKSDGSLTYFASDVAYHRDKFERGFDRVIDIWGAGSR
jgi:arginyl-tRNA synthetase